MVWIGGVELMHRRYGWCVETSGWVSKVFFVRYRLTVVPYKVGQRHVGYVFWLVWMYWALSRTENRRLTKTAALTYACHRYPPAFFDLLFDLRYPGLGDIELSYGWFLVTEGHWISIIDQLHALVRVMLATSGDPGFNCRRPKPDSDDGRSLVNAYSGGINIKLLIYSFSPGASTHNLIRSRKMWRRSYEQWIMLQQHRIYLKVKTELQNSPWPCLVLEKHCMFLQVHLGISSCSRDEQTFAFVFWWLLCLNCDSLGTTSQISNCRNAALFLDIGVFHRDRSSQPPLSRHVPISRYNSVFS